MNRWVVFILILAFAEVTPVRVVAQQSAPEVSQSGYRAAFLKPCQIPNVTGDALCGQYDVYENRETRQGRKIALNIQILVSSKSQPFPEPLFFLAGGPGGPATGLSSFAADAFAKVRNERDIVLLDQRGTGGSNALYCSLYGETLQGHLGDLIPIEAVQACRRDWESHADLRFYTTPFAVADLDEVRAALGYERINLFGTSYGTRVAQAYLRQYPNRVRAVILKGSTPISETFVETIARDAQRAFDLVIQDCLQDTNCRNAFPNLKDEYKSVLDRLTKGQVRVNILNTETGKSEEVDLSRGAFATTLRSLLQNAYNAAQVPLMIHQAFQNDFAPYVRLVKSLRAQGPVGSGTFLTILNAEDLPLTNPKKVKQVSAGTFIDDYYYQQVLRACADLPRTKLPRGFQSPVRSRVPVLFISGYRDPATPPENVDKIARFLSDSLHVVVRYGGHSYAGFAPCVDNVMADFISRGTTKGVDTSCVSQLRQIPFQVHAKPTTP